MTNTAPILYWFPGSLVVPESHRARFDRGGRECGSFARNTEGPEKDARGLLASPAPGVPVVYSARSQRWDRVAPGVWIGVVPGACRPAAFQREQTFRGYWRELGDGHDWLIPVVNPFAAGCGLPSRDVLRDGEWTRDIADGYRDVCERAAQLAATVRKSVLESREPEVDLDDAGLRQLLADALALNYDLTLEEMSALRLFGPEVYWPAVSAVIDWEGMQAALREAMGAANAQSPFGDSGVPGISDTDSGATA